MKHFLIIFGLFISSVTQAQQVKDFTLTNTQDGKAVSLSDYKSYKGVALIFTSNICPYSVYYEGRITQLIADYEEKGVAFILINSHTEDKESEEEMSNKISTWGLSVPYLSDKDQSVLNMFSARKSPEVYLLKGGNSFSVYYKGAIDNNPQVATDVKEQYLKDNIEALLKGQPSKAGGRPIGCMIKQN